MYIMPNSMTEIRTMKWKVESETHLNRVGSWGGP